MVSLSIIFMNDINRQLCAKRCKSSWSNPIAINIDTRPTLPISRWEKWQTICTGRQHGVVGILRTLQSSRSGSTFCMRVLEASPLPIYTTVTQSLLFWQRTSMFHKVKSRVYLRWPQQERQPGYCLSCHWPTSFLEESSPWHLYLWPQRFGKYQDPNIIFTITFWHHSAGLVYVWPKTSMSSSFWPTYRLASQASHKLCYHLWRSLLPPKLELLTSPLSELGQL